MTESSYSAEKTDHINPEVRDYVAAKLYSLQQARRDVRNNTTLGDLLLPRNPYYLRATRKAPWELVQCCLDNYLMSVDENLFASFLSDFATFLARRGQQLSETGVMLELFPLDDLPLRFELEEEYVRLYNRLTYQFYEDCCDEDSRVDWEKLTRFISNSGAQDLVQGNADGLA